MICLFCFPEMNPLESVWVIVVNVNDVSQMKVLRRFEAWQQIFPA